MMMVSGEGIDAAGNPFSVPRPKIFNVVSEWIAPKYYFEKKLFPAFGLG